MLLTDGANTRGIEPVDAAQVAAQRGVRVYPIGFGTTNPTSMVCTATSSAGGASRAAAAASSGGGLSGRNYLVADEATLQQVAEVTGGKYFAAADADQLQRVLADLPRTVQTQHRDVEVSVWLAGLAALLVLGSVGRRRAGPPSPRERPAREGEPGRPQGATVRTGHLG